MKKAKFVFLLLLACMLTGFFAYPGQCSAAVQTFYTPDTDIPIPVNFVNGDVEEPRLQEIVPPGSYNHDFTYTPTAGEFLAAPRNWLYIPDSEVPGWSAKPVDPADNDNIFANAIEVVLNTVNAQDGDQYIDMLGALDQEFYQIVDTTPGTNIYYSFWARRAFEMQFVCGPAGSETAVFTDTPPAAWKNYFGIYTAEANQTYFGYRCLNANQNWGTFTFNGVTYQNYKYDGSGPHLDSIKFQTQSKILIEKTVSAENTDGVFPGEVITYHFNVTNYGQTDTADTVLTDILGDDVEFAGNVQINGQDAGNLAVFDESMDRLTVYLGDGAAPARGGSIKGSVSVQDTVGESVTVSFDVKVIGEIGDTIRNQAAVSYDDKDFEIYTNGGYTDYSDISKVKIINAGRYPLELTKKLTAETGLHETFVFQIDQYSFDKSQLIKTFYTTVHVPAGAVVQTIYLEELYAGYYLVTELDSNWRYQATAASDKSRWVLVTNPYDPENVTVTNVKNKDTWVYHNNEAINRMIYF